MQKGICKEAIGKSCHQTHLIQRKAQQAGRLQTREAMLSAAWQLMHVCIRLQAGCARAIGHMPTVDAVLTMPFVCCLINIQM